MKQLPIDFEQNLRPVLGEDAYLRLVAALDESPAVSMRLNPFKCYPSAPHLSPNGQYIDSPVPWADYAFYLNERQAFTFDPLFHAGVYYVQEASSMFVSQAIKQYVNHAVMALDLCAAPGGKSTLLRSCLPQGSCLVSNEPMRQRAQVLAENMVKWGHPSTFVTNNYPADFSSMTHFFDLIVADVPCSGEGMFRKDSQAIDEWSMDNVLHCSKLQRDIIADIWPCLSPGGLLVYSTCTFNRLEDEENVAWIARHFDAEVLPVALNPAWQVSGPTAQGDVPCYHFFPGSTRGEGFFMAVLRKKDDGSEEGSALQRAQSLTAAVRRKDVKGKKNSAKTVELPTHKPCHEWLMHEEDYQWEVDGTHLLAIPSSLYAFWQLLKSGRTLLKAGVEVAELKGREWQPAHALAMAADGACAVHHFPVVNLSYSQALAYLRKESVSVDGQPSKGIVLLAYKGVPLGWGKCVGCRINNLYPQEWRIRSSYTTSFELME